MPEARTTTPPSASWAKVSALMHKQCGVVLGADQSYLLESRLQSVAKTHAFANVDAFVQAACQGSPNDPLQLALIDAMTTHESYFFRDTQFWQSLEQVILPKLAARGVPQLRIWSAACSYGQEAYSLAILLEEKFPTLAKDTVFLGTDVSEEAVGRAKKAVYSSLEVNRGIPATRLIRYFERAEGGFKVKASIAEKMSWQRHNLLGPPPKVDYYDIVLCRNVLIYFNEADRKTVVQNLNNAVRVGGYVGLGISETFLPANEAAGWYCRLKQESSR